MFCSSFSFYYLCHRIGKPRERLYIYVKLKNFTFMKETLIFLMSLLFAVLMVTSCSKSDDSDNIVPPSPTPENPTNPTSEDESDSPPAEPGFENLTDAQLDGYTSDLAVRLMFLAMNPDAEYNDIDLIDHYLNGLAYAYSKGTRGVWGQAKAALDFALVLKDANALHRSTLVGAMCKWGYRDKASRDAIWADIKKSKCLPSQYNSLSSDEFWKEFSSGKLDWYAKEVYKAVMDEAQDGFSRTGDLAAEMAANKLRHIDLTMSVAPKLVEAGCNIVFAFGDDLISNGKLAYDFVNTNGEVVLQMCNGNLTGDACLDMVNNNLKLLSKGLEEVVPTSQDLYELLSDLTFEQVKALNKEIEQVIKEAGNRYVTEGEISQFVANVKDIVIATPWKMNFADQEYVAKDGTVFEIETVNGKAYNFVYADQNENVLLEAKCSVKEGWITLRVDYLDDRCDLLPKGTAEGDIVPIPYLGVGSETAPVDITLWWKSDRHNMKSFQIKKETLFTDLIVEYNFAFSKYKYWRCVDKVFFTSDQISITKKGNLYTLKADKEENDISYTLNMEFEADGLNRDGRPNFGPAKKLSFYYIPLGGAKLPDGQTSGTVNDGLSFVLKNHPTRYVVNRYGDAYNIWDNDTDPMNVDEYSLWLKTFYTDKEPTTEQRIFGADDIGRVDVIGFYNVEDLSIY